MRHEAEYQSPNLQEEDSREWAQKPIVIADERTVSDGSVLVVDTVIEEDDSFTLKGVRFEAVHVPLTVANLEISNMSLDEVSVETACDDRCRLEWCLYFVSSGRFVV